MERGESSKRAPVESPMDEVKEEILDRDEAATREGALVNMESATARVELTVRIDVAKLHCPICMLPFKPPIFQCLSGHLACGVCHDQHPNKGRCLACGLAGAYVRCTVAEDIIESIRIQCPYDAYGCRSYVTYHADRDHQHACPWAPCACAEPGCGFLGSPPMLRDHLRDAHAWPVDKVRYSRAHNLRLPASQPRCLLDAEGDGRVFIVSTGAHGGGERHGAAVSCVRASAAAGPRYYCKMWATGNLDPETGRVGVAMAETGVPSISSVPGGAAPAVAPLSVLRTMLHGESMEMHLSVKICMAPSFFR
ncbi:unnamed protein product [Urochloa decumbens]|uniref:RING-type E3 ubiquitin transferase n=1 Tax=Urochloa decumbens TaxID=240449 RepID=A0ABC8ZCL4_9POAL